MMNEYMDKMMETKYGRRLMQIMCKIVWKFFNDYSGKEEEVLEFDNYYMKIIPKEKEKIEEFGGKEDV